MEIRGEKEADYIAKLYFDFENQGMLQKALNKVRRRDQRYTKSELAEFLDRRTATYAHEFLDKLIEHDILEQAGKRKTASNQVDTWELDKSKLLDEYAESEYFQKRKDLDAAALDHIGEAFKFN
jgi:hypothetical protein